MMPQYAHKAITCFKYPTPQKPQYQPHPYVPPRYGQKQQFVEPVDTMPSLNKKMTKFIQEVTSTYLFMQEPLTAPF